MTDSDQLKISGSERAALLDRVEEKAAFYMNRYGGCGQCSLRALQEEFQLPGGTAALKAAGFTNLGIALTGTICGAFLGGIMAMGLACGRDDFSDTMYPQPEVVDEAHGLPRSLILIREYYQRFIREFGSWSCRDLQIRVFGKAARLAAETILELPRR